MQDNSADDVRDRVAGGSRIAAEQEGFELGTPALVCRWRLSGGTLPMANRHLRALAARSLDGVPVSTQLIAWAKQHIEWTLADGTRRDPDGVLMLVVDDSGRAAMSCGPYEAPLATSVSSLAERARRSQVEATETGVAPETLWLVRGDTLACGAAPDSTASGAASLIGDLAATLGIPVVREEGLVDSVIAGVATYDEAFLVSDEHGVVVAGDASGKRSERFAGGYARLMEKTRGTSRP